MPCNHRQIIIAAGLTSLTLLGILLKSWKRCQVLKRLKSDFIVSQIQLLNVAKSMCNDMTSGLQDDDQILKMIPSFVSSLPDPSISGQYLALDLGGSNFRVLLVTILDGFSPSNLVKYLLLVKNSPFLIGRKLQQETFYLILLLYRLKRF